MKTEVKLFILTKYLMAFFNDDEKIVMKILINLFGKTKYWNSWFPRYHQIIKSKETQIALFRQAEIPYRKIQHLLKTSPKTIRMVVQTYKLKYEPLKHVEDIEQVMEEVEERLKERKLELW